MRKATWMLRMVMWGAFAAPGCDREREVGAASIPAAQIDDARDPAITPTTVPVASDPPPPAVASLAVADRLPRVATRAADGTEGCGPCRAVMPVDIAVGPGEALGAAPAITLDPTVVLIDGDDAVQWIGGVGAHWRELDVAITRVLAAP